MLALDAPSRALLSILGVPGWGPLHLLLQRRADPAQLAGRLRQSLSLAGLPLSGCDVRGGRLLAALLRSQADLDPVAAIADGSALVGLRYRYRLVCRPAGALYIRSWERSGLGGAWSALGPAQRLEAFLQLAPARDGCRPLGCPGGAGLAISAWPRSVVNDSPGSSAIQASD